MNRFGIDPGKRIGFEGCTTNKIYNSIEDFLIECNINEVETLNSFATSGACQFSAIGEQMYFYLFIDLINYLVLNLDLIFY